MFTFQIPPPEVAVGPPRLAAGAGDRLSETLDNISISHPVAGFSLRFLLRSGRGLPRGGNGERQLALGARLASQFPIQVDGDDDSGPSPWGPARSGGTPSIAGHAHAREWRASASAFSWGPSALARATSQRPRRNQSFFIGRWLPIYPTRVTDQKWPACGQPADQKKTLISVRRPNSKISILEVGQVDMASKIRLHPPRLTPWISRGP